MGEIHVSSLKVGDVLENYGKVLYIREGLSSCDAVCVEQYGKKKWIAVPKEVKNGRTENVRKDDCLE